MATGVTSSITSDVSFDSKYQLTSDDDILYIIGATVTLREPQGEIFTMEGNDQVQIENAVIATSESELSLSLGSGDDSLSLKNCTLTVDVNMFTGDDVLVVDGSIQSRVRLNKKLLFGAGNDVLELISVLENAGSISFGTGKNTLRFNGGALLPVQLTGSTYGTISSFTNLDVTLSGGTTGCNLKLEGEQTSITLNGNLFGTTAAKQISVSGGTTTLAVASNVRTNVHLQLNNMRLVHLDGAILEFSDHSGYAVIANNSVIDLHDIVVKGGQGLTGSNTAWTIENSDFSNALTGIDLAGGSLDFKNGGLADFSITAVILNSTNMTGSKVSLTNNQGLGAMRITGGAIEIRDFRANSNQNKVIDSVTSYVYTNNRASASASAFVSGGAIILNGGGSMSLTSASFSGNTVSASTFVSAYYANGFFANTSASAYGGAICQSGGSMSLTSAVFSGNKASASGYASGAFYNYYSSYDSCSVQARTWAEGGAICQSGGNMSLTSAAFSGNIASAGVFAVARRTSGGYSSGISQYYTYASGYAYAYGGAIFQTGGNLTLSNAVFSGNKASASANANALYYSAFAHVFGGAVCLNSAIVNMENTVFSGNTASAYVLNIGEAWAYGGAIHLNSTTLNYFVTSGNSIANVGNAVSTPAAGAIYSALGGWLYISNQSTMNITVDADGLLTIGDSTGNDSIAGNDNCRITKNGTGLMVINSDIANYTGLWTVTEGTLELARISRTIKLDNWTIGTDATLILSVKNDIINMTMSKKIGTIDLGGGADAIHTGGYDLTEGTILLNDLTLDGGGRVSVNLRNRSTTAGSTLRLNGVYLDSEFTGNNYTDTILINEESTLNGAIELADGSNLISATKNTTFGSTLTAGTGNDVLNFTSVQFNGAVNLGGGDNSLTATGSAGFAGTLKTGAGNDTLSFASVTFEDTVALGNGSNSLTATGTAKFSKAFTAGSGKDTLTFAAVTFEKDIDLGDGDNSLTANGTAKLQGITGGAGKDTIALYGSSTIGGEIDLGGGVNGIAVRNTLTADKVRVTENGQTSIYVYNGSTLTNNTLTVYSDESAARDTITLRWSEQSDLDKVRILVSSDPSSFQDDRYEFAVELYNQSKSFTLNLQKGYFIQFQAQDADGWKQRLLDDHTAPDQVTGVYFSGSTLSWDATHDNPGGNGVMQYHVDVSEDASFSTLLQSATVTGTEFSPVSLPETTLYFRVKAEDYTGNIGEWSETVSGLLDTTAPTRPSGGQSSVNGYSATLSWSAAGDTGSGVSYYEYRIATDSSYGQIVTSGTTETCSVSVDGLGYGTYSWSVRAVDAAGNEGAWSLSKTFATVDAIAPGMPTNLDYGIENETSLIVIWDASNDDALGSGMSGYQVQLAKDAAFVNDVQTISVTATEAAIDNLANATYYLRVCAVDNAGNKSDWTDTVSFSIVSVDAVPPTVSNVHADITGPTNQNVTVTAVFNDNVELAQSLYRIGSTGQWRDYVSGVTLTENATVYFKAVDAAGNESEDISISVSNIDKTAPTIRDVQADITEPTTGSVTVTATFSDNVELAQSLYRIGETGDWKSYANGVTLTENATVYFKAVDTAGNESEVVSCSVENIEPPPETISGLVISNGVASVSSGFIYEDTTILDGGKMYVSSGGVANDTAVNDSGSMTVCSSGAANSTTVNANGYLYVSSGGTANDTIIHNGGCMAINSGCVASSTIVYCSGEAINGTYPGGQVTVASGGTAFDTTLSGGFMFIYSGGTVNSTTVCSGGWMVITGSANGLVVLSGGLVQGEGENITGLSAEYGARLDLSVGSRNYIAGEYAGSSFEIKDGQICDYALGFELGINSGGTANRLTINGGSLRVYHGTANSTVVNGGGMTVYRTANSTTVNSRGGMYVETGNFMIYSNGGSQSIREKGTANDTIINYGGSVYVYSGGTVNRTAISGGWMSVVSGGTANDTTVSSGGMNISSGGKLTGQTTIEAGATVSAFSGAILDFDISTLAPGATARINDLSKISGWSDAVCTLTVDGTQANGTYKLAEGAAGFDRTITVMNAAGDELGTLTVGAAVNIGGADYTLNLGGDNILTLTIGTVTPDPEPVTAPAFFTGCFSGGTQAMLAAQTDREVTVYADGDTWGYGLVLDPGWQIAGVGDFNGDGRDDFLRINDEGYVVEEMTRINGKFSPQVLNFLGEGWQILGTGDFDGNGSDDVLVANPTGASETVGLLGYWESGSTWTLINGYSAEWECVSTGDFNGDGKCDMLWRNSFEGAGGLTYNAYCTWIMDDPVDWRMVSVANPDEWDFLCSGDFDGNGSHDIAMINDVGIVGIWGVDDGYLNSWSILSAATSQWTLAGVADFNADGTDDIAWCNIDTGLVGYWQINDKQLTAWSNIATIA